MYILINSADLRIMLIKPALRDSGSICSSWLYTDMPKKTQQEWLPNSSLFLEKMETIFTNSSSISDHPQHSRSSIQSHLTFWMTLFIKLQTLYYFNFPIHKFVYKNSLFTITVKNKQEVTIEMNNTKLITVELNC